MRGILKRTSVQDGFGRGRVVVIEGVMRMTTLAALLVISIAATAEKPKPVESGTGLPALSAKIASMRHLGGLLPLDWDARAGKLYVEIPHLGPDGKSADLIYTNALPYGTGSNDLGLDRGQLSVGRVVRFERSGPKVLLVQ